MMIILNKNAIKLLSEKLNLPISGYEQDWDIELANPARLDDFLLFFSDNYQYLSDDEKRGMFSLIVATLEEKLN